MTATLIASWLLTYLLHSTVLLCAALVVSRSMNGSNLTVQEILLRAALFGGILTATLQIGLGISPLTGVVALDTAQPQAAAPIASLEISAADSSLPANAATGRSFALDWAAALIALWGLGSILALLGVLRSVVDLKRLLRTRCFQPAGRLVENLATAMGLHKRVKLSTSKAIAVPFATGIRQPEICCPERVEELAREHRTSLFAHELAHLARRDPAWQLLYRLGEAILVLQPLNRLVRRRLEEIAEHLTDERAVACTGDRLGLARCLVVVAHWGFSSRIGLPATALASGPRLDRRVQRLISGAADHHLGSRWALPIIITLLVGAVAVLPTFGTNPAHAESTGSPSVDAKTWSTPDDRPSTAPPAPLPPAPIEADLAVPAPDSPAQPAAPRSAAAPRPAAVPRASAQPEPTLPEEPDQPEKLTLPEKPTLPEEATRPEEFTRPEEPTQPEKPTRPEELEQRRSARESQRESERARTSEEQRARAEAKAYSRQRASEKRAREHAVRAEERAREQQRTAEERAREHAARAAERSKISRAQKAELRQQLIELRREVRVQNSEEAQAMRERARALSAEARTLEREAAGRQSQLSEEQRVELQRQATELRILAEAQRREFAREARERAQSLSEEARRLAEESEAERRRLEELEQQDGLR